MNKQEAIEKIKNLDTLNINDRVAGQQVDMVIKNQVLDIISKIDEPQKPVVPKFVANFYESIKDDFEDEVYGLCLQFDRDNGELSSELYEWFDCWKNEPIQTLVKMKLYGYEIEKEKLYTVEIADAILTKITRGCNVQYKMLPSKDVSDVFDKAIYTTKLTEQEIKQKDERLWQWAKEETDE